MAANSKVSGSNLQRIRHYNWPLENKSKQI